nr:hypothetical protein [Kibdelosporangium sp. MJ126-NF4]CTQ96318.1 hypothetical protein [Kibdelosporangium sp. MJ126-NF4]
MTLRDLGVLFMPRFLRRCSRAHWPVSVQLSPDRVDTVAI